MQTASLARPSATAPSIQQSTFKQSTFKQRASNFLSRITGRTNNAATNAAKSNGQKSREDIRETPRTNNKMRAIQPINFDTSTIIPIHSAEDTLEKLTNQLENWVLDGQGTEKTARSDLMKSISAAHPKMEKEKIIIDGDLKLHLSSIAEFAGIEEHNLLTLGYLPEIPEEHVGTGIKLSIEKLAKLKLPACITVKGDLTLSCYRDRDPIDNLSHLKAKLILQCLMNYGYLNVEGKIVHEF
jgi:hypothetical protein